MKIGKEELKHLAELSRIDIRDRESDKLLKSVQDILSYVEELNEVDTSGVPTMDGGAFERNAFRNDDAIGKNDNESDKIKRSFPEEESGYLKVPAIFE